MKHTLIFALSTILLLQAHLSMAQDSTSVNFSDSIHCTNVKTAEQMLAEMQQQLAQMQLQLNQVQSKVCAPKQPRDIIPAGKKSKSRFFWSIQFGFFLKSDEYQEGGTSKESLGTKFSYALKPAFGYIFNDRMSAGCKIVFADCQFSGLQSSASFRYIIANALIGGGASLSDYITWSVQPYYRYRITKVFWDRVNLWGEISAYAGQNIPRDTNTRQLQPQETSTIYGVSISPMITCDLNRNLMIFTTMDLLSWNGSFKKNEDIGLQNNSFNFQFIPIYTILTGLFNIGIIKRF